MEIVEYIEEKLTGRLPELRNTVIPVKQEDKYVPDFATRQTIEIEQKDFPKIFQMLPESLRKKAKKCRVKACRSCLKIVNVLRIPGNTPIMIKSSVL